MTYGAEYWDERYRTRDRVWGSAPNRWVEHEVADLPPGTALDLACGEGRNAVWLAARGWQVIASTSRPWAWRRAANSSSRARHGLDHLARGRCDAISRSAPGRPRVAVYLQLRAPAPRRRARPRPPRSVPAAPCWSSPTTRATSPTAPAVRRTPRSSTRPWTSAHDLEPTDLVIERADEVLRPVEGARRPAIDALLRARRPGG